MKTRWHSVAAVVAAASAVVLSQACSSVTPPVDDEPADESGGSDTRGNSSTGQAGKGGTTGGSGGSSAAGKGGSTAKEVGGTPNTGGSSKAAAGGAAGKGDTVAKGGSTSTGSGGSTKAGTGGSTEKGVGGAGGKPVTSSAGGSSGTGGSVAAGGSSGTAGKSAGTGGSTSPAGAGGSTTPTGPAASFKCGIPAAGTAGQAKPSGKAGGLKVLDWAGFKSAVSYTFDDANSSQISNYTAMNATGGKFTFFLQTGKSEAGNAVWKTALQDGHELGNHTKSHSQNYSDADAQAGYDFIKQTFGITPYSFAAPNGTSNWQSVSPKYFLNRSVSGGSVSAYDSTNAGWLPSNVPAQSAPASAMGPAAGKWQIYCIHGFSGGSNDGAYQPLNFSDWQSAAKSAVQGGAWVDTMATVGAYWAGQKAIGKSPTGTKITWTLPAVFPPNKCVRVTVDGGTLTQNGQALTWDEHGYYEVSLDAKSLEIAD